MAVCCKKSDFCVDYRMHKSKLCRKDYKNIIYKGKKLKDYCKSNGIEYKNISSRCRYFISKGKNISEITENVIDGFIESYLSKKEIDYIRIKFKDLENNDISKKQMCEILNIDYQNFKKMNRRIRNVNLIFIAWYSSDKNDGNGKYISIDKFNLLKLGNGLDINDLFGMYKSGQSEYLHKIIDFEKNFIKGFINKTLRNHGYKFSKDLYDDLYSQAILILLNCIKRSIACEPEKISKYLEKSIKNQLRNYLIKNYPKENLSYNDDILLNNRYKNSYGY